MGTLAVWLKEGSKCAHDSSIPATQCMNEGCIAITIDGIHMDSRTDQQWDRDVPSHAIGGGRHE
jgi:hypothetical protein